MDLPEEFLNKWLVQLTCKLKDALKKRLDLYL
jgi:hypothetical protein